MIPLRLQLKNFISYGPEMQTIDFGPYPLICLSGKNGHGKSALLDALTWAVWGQARKTATAVKADNNLLHLGQTHMMVIFDFEFNNQKYRIKREYAQTYGKPYAQLEFGILDDDNTTIHPLTDKTIRATQEKIQEHLGLDFNAFTNSAFLRQGHSNEFSKKSPKERKEILASILSLKQYEVIRKCALEKTRTGTAEITLTQQLQARLKVELDKKDEITALLQAVTDQLKAITVEEKKITTDHQLLTQKKKEYATAEQQFKLVQFQCEQHRIQEEAQQKKLRELYQVWKNIHAKQRSLPDKKEVVSEKTGIEKKIAEHTTRLHTHLELKEKLLNTKEEEYKIVAECQAQQRTTITQQQVQVQQLQSEKKAYTDTRSELEKKSANTQKDIDQITHELRNLQQKKATLESDEKVLLTLEAQFEKRKQFYHKWIAQANMYTNERTQIEDKKRLTHDADNPSCPLCEQNLSASRKRFLHTKLMQQESWIAHRLKRFTMLIQALKKVLVDQHQQLATIKKKAQEHKETVTNYDHLQKTIIKLLTSHNEDKQRLADIGSKETLVATKIIEATTALEQVLKQEKQNIEANSSYQEIKKKREALELQLKEIVYNAQAHEQDKQRLLTLENQLNTYAQVDEQQRVAQQTRQQINEIVTTLRKLKKEKSALLEQIKTFDYLRKIEQEITHKEEALEAQIKTVHKQKEELFHEKGKLENQKTKLEHIDKELKAHEKTIGILQETVNDYQTIATAMSKDGIQALLIENAIPEIEHEANLLLGQLTDNQAHIFIESLRDLKKGGTKETLDIVISDSSGIRPYELFSGGEAFRIDFALRIAISKLLARRAGTSLQTLIIDEGFGSQDEEGLSRIMDALYKIQDNFKKIIVVSHLGWMKDQFPVQFSVHKGPNGSIVNMIEQG